MKILLIYPNVRGMNGKANKGVFYKTYEFSKVT